MFLMPGFKGLSQNSLQLHSVGKRHPLHSICPYFAMFPEDFVERHVLAHTKAGELVFDPFSGRGTTVFQSLLLNREAAGTDINPVAACISGAKADAPDLLSVLERIGHLEKNYRAPDVGQMPHFFSKCFHAATLPQVLYLRSGLRWSVDKVDRFIAAMALGALHGESHRSKNYFSNRMPRTISTKPEYSVRWWDAKGLLAPDRDVFLILRDLAKFRLDRDLPASRGSVILADARRASQVHPSLNGQVKLVVTSPPYVDMTDYAEDQWLRLWFLGGSDHPRPRSYADDRHTQKQAYWTFLTEVWSGLSDLLADRAVIVVRIGGKLELDEIAEGLIESIRAGMPTAKVSLQSDVSTSDLKKRQVNAFRPGTKAGVEHDFIFDVRRTGAIPTKGEQATLDSRSCAFA